MQEWRGVMTKIDGTIRRDVERKGGAGRGVGIQIKWGGGGGGAGGGGGVVVFFFFSSRRRHTRLVRDWSSDVCSSDLSSP